jgi:hypothetical protein
MTFPKLPGLGALRNGEKSLLDWSRQVTQHIEALEGVHNGDRVVMQSDMDAIKKVVNGISGEKRAVNPGDLPIDLGGGLQGSISIDTLVERLVSNKRMQETFLQAIMQVPYGSSVSGTTVTQTQNLLQSRIDAAANVADSAASSAAAASRDAYEAKQLALQGSSGSGRGSIVGFGSLANFNTNVWRDDVAIFVIQQNLGVNQPGVVPSPTDTGKLVTGDMVTLLGVDGTTVITKQWIKSMGWMDTGTFLGGNVMLDGSIPPTKVRSTMLPFLDTMFGTMAGTFYANGNITVNYGGLSLAYLANKAASTRSPIWCYGNIGTTAFPSLAWDDDLASWCILLNVTGNVPTFTRPMPATYLVAGDTVNLRTVDQTTANITKTWTGSYWA